MTEVATASTVQAKPALGVLESSGLIRLAATHPELEYLFRHVLVQDAAYDSLLKQERRRLHLAVAETLEQLYPERRAELSAMLAYHCDAAGEPARALPFLVEAGEHALARYANEEAEGFFERAAELVPPGDDPELVRLRAEIALGRATSGWASRAPQTTLAIIDEVLPLAERLGDIRLLGQVLFWRAFLLGNFGGDPGEGADLWATIERGLAIARETGNRPLEGTFLTVSGNATTPHDPRRATQILEQALTLTSDADFIGSSLTANALASVYASLGEWDRAEATLERSRQLAEKSGDPKVIVDASIAASGVALERGDVERSIEHANEGARRADAIGAQVCSVIANWIAGRGELEANRPDRALLSFGRSNELSIQLDERYFRNQTDAGMSQARCQLGSTGEAEEGWTTTLGAARAMGDPTMEADILLGRAQARSGLPEPDWSDVVADLDGAVSLYERLDLRPRLVRALELRATALDAAGRPDDAARSHAQAQEIGDSIGFDPARRSVVLA